MTRPRDYAYEALAEVTGSDQTVGRGALNAALRDIRSQSEIEDSYLLSAEIHERAKMYRSVFPEAALTPTALAKHWERVRVESVKKRGTNLSAEKFERPKPLSPTRREQNLAEARLLMSQLWGKGEDHETATAADGEDSLQQAPEREGVR